MPTRKREQRVALFGGSFNPPHLGHVAIVRWLLTQPELDAIWIIPCFIHPFGKELVPFNDRYRMSLFSFSPFGRRVIVTDVERKLGGTSHTIRTIHQLQAQFPQNVFSLVTGADSIAAADEWRDFDQIRREVEIITLPRGPQSPIPDIASTTIRDLVRVGRPIKHLVAIEVAVYILTHQLYR